MFPSTHPGKRIIPPPHTTHLHRDIMGSAHQTPSRLSLHQLSTTNSAPDAPRKECVLTPARHRVSKPKPKTSAGQEHAGVCVCSREKLSFLCTNICRYMPLIHIATPGLMARVGVLSECGPRTHWGTGDKVGGRAGHVKGILPRSGTRNSPVQLCLWT